MAGNAAKAPQDASNEPLSLLALNDGTAGHAYAAPAVDGQPCGLTGSLVNLADAVHYLCMLHGRHPGVSDHAAIHGNEEDALSWLIAAAEGFAAERAYLTQLTVAVGPLPSTAGQNQCETALLQQLHALDTLAQSDRRGCAVGAVMALILDWSAIRRILDRTAIRVGLEPRTCRLPSREETLALARMLGEDAMVERAIRFGARQLIAQHRGLWDLLQARAVIRAQD